MSTSKRGPRKQSSTSKRSNNNNGRTGRGGSNRATKNPKSRSNQGYRGADDRKPQGGAPRKYKKKPSARNDDILDPIPGNQEWGGLARKGVLRVHHDDLKSLDAPAEVKEELEPDELERREERKRRREERDRREEELRSEARAAIDRAQKSVTKETKQTPRALRRKPITRGPMQLGEMQPRFKKSFGAEQGKKNLKAFFDSMRAFEEERFTDAGRKLRPLIKADHRIPEIYELYGLILYRKEEFTDAADWLEKFRHLASSTEQHPVLMDCYRAEKRWNDVDYLWDELREVSPSGSLVVEGRIVMAGALADRGNLKKAVYLLEKGWKAPKRPRDHHLRRAYALGDLYDRAGNLPRAREMFQWIVSFAPSFVDARDRLKNLN
ncbi:MAG: hypothetical protein CL423_04735 [Acidimicrobiaceae bacterium]|nr:hypothetical protein [Acidimicrobiaceae bacterium]